MKTDCDAAHVGNAADFLGAQVKLARTGDKYGKKDADQHTRQNCVQQCYAAASTGLLPARFNLKPQIFD